MDGDSDDDCPSLVEVAKPDFVPPTGRKLESKDPPKPKVPVTILTGFLGSGKTTLLNYILTANHQLRVAVVMNEFNMAGSEIEKQLTIAQQGEMVDDWVELPNGCVCCSAKGQAVSVIEEMVKKKNMDHVILETSGLADPGPLISSFWVDEALESLIYLDGTITVVDAKHIEKYLQRVSEPGAENDEAEGGGYHEAARQVAYADKIIINKVDLIGDDYLSHLQSLLSGINTSADMVPASFAKIDNVAALLAINGLGFDKDVTKQNHSHSGDHDHTNCKTDSCKDHGHHHHHVHDLGHVHTETVTTIYIELEGSLQNEDAIDDLMKELLFETKAPGFLLLRVKALFNVDSQGYQVGLQAVMDMFDTKPTKSETKEGTMNKLVFIGKGLDSVDLKSVCMKHFGAN